MSLLTIMQECSALSMCVTEALISIFQVRFGNTEHILSAPFFHFLKFTLLEHAYM